MPLRDSLVFMTEDGLAINGSWFAKHFQQLLHRAGLPTPSERQCEHDSLHGLLVGPTVSGAGGRSTRPTHVAALDTRTLGRERYP